MTNAIPSGDEGTPVAETQAADKSKTRLPALDLIRGVAILGILPVHISIFGGSGFTPQPGTDGLSALLGMCPMLLVEGKMVTLLAILFGVGLGIQANRADAKGRPFTRFWIRRMSFLFLIGLAHALFLFQWDILTSYAVAGMGALFLNRFSTRAIKCVAAACFGWCYTLIFPCLLLAVMFQDQSGGVSKQADETTGDIVVEVPSAGETSAETDSDFGSFFSEEHDVRIFRHGNFADMVIHRAIYLAAVAAVFILIAGWYTLACFLTGMVLCRCKAFHDVSTNLNLWRKFIVLGIPVGLVSHAIGVVMYARDPEGLLPICVFAIGILPLALGYLALLTLWAHDGRVRWLRKILESVGRLALSNYLLQSLLCGFLFYSYGFAFYGQLGHEALLIVVLCVWIAQMFLSSLYLRFFRMGPIEWLWRSLTEGRLCEFRRVATNV